MPPGKHLSWMDWDDFTPGVWETGFGTTSKIATPPNAAAVLQDYRPMKGGGLRAFQKGKRTLSDNSTKIASNISTNASIAGVMLHGGITTRPGKGGGSLLTGAAVDSQELLVVTINRSDFKMRILRMDLSNDDTSYSTLYSDPSGHSTANHAPTSWAAFNTTSGDVYNLLAESGGGNRGLFAVGYEDGAQGTGIDGDVTKLCSKVGPVIVHQARILVAGQTGASPDNDSIDAEIAYSDIGALTFDSDQTVLVSPNTSLAGAISLMSAIEPQDILVGKYAAPWTLLSGDISSPSLSQRDMGNEHHTRRSIQPAIQVPGGIAFTEADGRVFITDGRDFTSISDMLDRFPGLTGASGAQRTAPGQLMYANGLLFGARGFVYDFETQAWFRQTGLPTAMSWSYDAHFGEVLGAAMNISETGWDGSTVDTDNSMAVFKSHPTASSDYSPTATVQSMPFYDRDGRNVRIREVQVFHTPHRTSGTLCVELLDPSGTTIGTANSKTTGTAGRPDMTSFLFPGLPKNAQSVKVFANSGGNAAAHTIEKIRIGFDANNSLSVSQA